MEDDAALLAQNLGCCECEQRVGSVDELDAHLSREHLAWLPYECSVCGANEPTETTLRRHLQLSHPNAAADARLLYQPDKAVKRRLKLLRQRCLDKARENSSVDEDKTAKLVETPRGHFKDISWQPGHSPFSKSELADLACSTPMPERESGRRQLVQVEERSLSAWELRSLDRTFCLLCQTRVTSKTPLDHIYNEHLKKKPFRCTVCNTASTRRDSIANHTKRVHANEGNTASFLDDRRQALTVEVDTWQRRCFAVKPTAQKSRSPLLGTDQHVSLNHATPSPDVEDAATPLVGAQSDNESAQQDGTEAQQPRLTAWQMRLRDTTFCVVCNGRSGGHPSVHIYTRHMRRQWPYACSICSFQGYQPSLVKSHSKVHRDDADVFSVVDRRQQIEPEYNRWFARCYAVKSQDPRAKVPLREGGKQAEPRNDSGSADEKSDLTDKSAIKDDSATVAQRRQPSWKELRRNISFCVVCRAEVKRGHAIEHIYRTHVNSFPFRCSVCNRGGNSAVSIKTHIKAVHKNEEASCVDLRDGLQVEYDSWHERCYDLKEEFKAKRQGSVEEDSMSPKRRCI